MKEKTPLSHEVVCVYYVRVENYFFLENYGTSEGAVSHNVLYHQPLPITRHQVRFYANTSLSNYQ